MTATGVLVTGDLIVDHHVYEGRRHHYSQPLHDGVHVRAELGGAALVARLLDELVPGSVRLHPHVPSKGFRRADSAYAFWRPFPRNAPRERQYWRVAEAMGFGTHEGDLPAVAIAPASGDVAVVVIADGGLGFRNESSAWPHAEINAARWIVLKMSAPVAEGPLWEFLISNHADRLVVVVAGRELRQSAARLPLGLSWESTLGSLVEETQSGRSLHALMRCRHLIVSFESEGAAWLDVPQKADRTMPIDGVRVNLVHDAPVIEGERATAIDGRAFGLQSCLAAAVASQMIRPEPDVIRAIEGGLSAARDLIEKGHGLATEPPDGFPSSRLGPAIARPPVVFSRLTVNATTTIVQPTWSALGESLGASRTVFDLARLVLLRGPIALDNLPHLSVGKLLTAERREVESLRTLTQIVRRYQQHDAGKKPLSLAVFGPPGAGKSFAVREVASHVIGANAAWLEFNLSQFSGPDDLIGAFHQVRDCVLQGKLPVAFFDEFDAHGYRWLAPLLAPMQDGRFQDGQLTHTLGKCLFAFAGGTSWTFETFGPPAPAPGASEESEAWHDFRLAKGPDFKSRIDGYLNVVGPNRRMIPATEGCAPTAMVGGHGFVPDADDDAHIVRRALLIRAELGCQRDAKLDIDDGLVHALLRVSSYTHGARSLGKVVQPFAAAPGGRITQSLLLPDAQLAMHVNATAFLALCRDAEAVPPPIGLTDARITQIAPAIHDTWRELGRRAGWLKPAGDVPFDALTDFLKDSNRAAATRMAETLALVGLCLGEERAALAEEQAVRERLELVLETLAEAEHEGWHRWHVSRGWRWAPKRDDAKCQHPCLRPYLQLTKEEQDKDRDAVRHYPDFARTAGLKIVPIADR